MGIAFTFSVWAFRVSSRFVHGECVLSLQNFVLDLTIRYQDLLKAFDPVFTSGQDIHLVYELSVLVHCVCVCINFASSPLPGTRTCPRLWTLRPVTWSLTGASFRPKTCPLQRGPSYGRYGKNPKDEAWEGKTSASVCVFVLCRQSVNGMWNIHESVIWVHEMKQAEYL